MAGMVNVRQHHSVCSQCTMASGLRVDISIGAEDNVTIAKWMATRVCTLVLLTSYITCN